MTQLNELRVYVGAPWQLKDRAACTAEVLRNQGAVVVSSWHDTDPPEDEAAARRDLAELAQAELLWMINPADWANRGTGGRHVEYGFALAAGLGICIEGVASNVFHRLPTFNPTEVARLGLVSGLVSGPALLIAPDIASLLPTLPLLLAVLRARRSWHGALRTAAVRP